jgi:glutamine cyclotransferase
LSLGARHAKRGKGALNQAPADSAQEFTERRVTPFKILVTLVVGLAALSTPARASTPVYGYSVAHTYPHDPAAFTEGLFYLNGVLYESTGLEGKSDIRKVQLATGKVLQRRPLDGKYFGEGIIAWKGRLAELTWQSQIGFTYDLATFKPRSSFHYMGEGWALTHDGHRLIMSDGTPELRFLDPETLGETGRLKVMFNGKPLAMINELEWVKGEILANVWQTNYIVRIDPRTGVVTGVIDLSPLVRQEQAKGQIDVLNGIAYDAEHDRLFVTGKLWPDLYEIKLTGPTPGVSAN